MGNGAIEPLGGGVAPGGRGAQQRAFPSATRRGAAASHQATLDELVDRPIRERTRQCPDAAEVTSRGEQRTDRPTVLDPFADEGETGVLGEPEFDVRGAS